MSKLYSLDRHRTGSSQRADFGDESSQEQTLRNRRFADKQEWIARESERLNFL